MRLNRSRITFAFIIAFGLATGLAACASGGGPGTPRRNPNVITAEELDEYATLSAMDLIRRLRPRWLQGRGASTSGVERPEVLLDGSRMGDPETALATISVATITELRYLSASDATMRYGTGFSGGAIEIISKGR